MPYIFIDAGHGGRDSGAVGFGLYEKNVCLDLAKKINNHFGEYKDAAVSLTRWDDRFIDLSERAEMANQRGADLFISIHNNAATPTANGFESFIHDNAGSKTANYQNVLHKHIMDYLSRYNIRDRGKKRADFAVLRNTKMSAILLENLFITNEKENKLLRDNEFLDGLAAAIVAGVADAFGLKKKDTTQKPMYRVTVDGDVIYDTAYETKITEAVMNAVREEAEEISVKKR
jgi:N-acetylmuramoyl-L-alanine amidase